MRKVKLYGELRRLIKDNYGTYYNFAETVLHIHRGALQYKLSGKNPFNLDEISLIQKTFNLTDEQVVRFFLHKDLQTRTKRKEE